MTDNRAIVLELEAKKLDKKVALLLFFLGYSCQSLWLKEAAVTSHTRAHTRTHESSLQGKVRLILLLFSSGHLWEVRSIPGDFQKGSRWKVAAGPQDRGNQNNCRPLPNAPVRLCLSLVTQ